MAEENSQQEQQQKQEKQTQQQEQKTEVKFTQEDLNKLLQERLATEKTKHQKINILRRLPYLSQTLDKEFYPIHLRFFLNILLLH